MRRICAKYPGDYWRGLEDALAYPTEFVDDLTAGGFLAALIPQEYGGAGLPIRAAAVILEEINVAGCTATPVPRADVHHGHRAAARQRGAEAALPAGDRARRIAAAGVRRHRADHRLRHHQAEDPRGARGQRPLRRQRPEGVDLARAAFRPDAAAGAHHAGRGGEEAHRRALGVPGRHPRGARQGHGDPAARGDDQPQHHRDLLRQSRSAGREPDRRGRAGASLHPRRHERRAHPGRLGSGRRRPLVPEEGGRLRQRAASCSAARSARTRACSFRSRAPMPSSRPPT